MIVGMHHVAISVPDLDEATRFYVDVLGFTEAFAGEWDDKPMNDRVIGVDGTAAKVKMLRTANAYVELWEFKRPEPARRHPNYSPADHGYAHICLQVTDILAEHARLSAGGMTFHGPPVVLGPSAAIYGRDPFGNIIELYQVTGANALPAMPTAPDASADRLRRLEDIEEIRRLKAAYCSACDDDHNGEAVVALFVADGSWTNSMDREYVGHDAIRGNFDRIRASGRIRCSTHMVTNPVIDVDGDAAAGTWSFVMMYTSPNQDRFRILGFYRERYVRRDGRWLFRSLYSDVQDYVRIESTNVRP